MATIVPLCILIHRDGTHKKSYDLRENISSTVLFNNNHDARRCFLVFHRDKALVRSEISVFTCMH